MELMWYNGGRQLTGVFQMPITEDEIRGFADYAKRRLGNGGADSLEECLQQWRAEQIDSETVASIRRGLDQADAGQSRAFHEVDADIQKKYGFTVDE